MEQEKEEISKERLIEEIEELKTRIKNTEYDLAHMFKGNSFLDQKLTISKQALQEKIKILEIINSQKEIKEKAKKQEEEIIEASDIPISSNQERIIEEEIEDEFKK